MRNIDRSKGLFALHKSMLLQSNPAMTLYLERSRRMRILLRRLMPCGVRQFNRVHFP